MTEIVGSAGGLQAAHRTDPLGLPVRDTFLSWVPGDAADTYEVAVRDEQDELIWSSSTRQPWAVLPGELLRSRGRYAWTVESPQGAAAAVFETGLADTSAWTAEWIEAPRTPFAREGYDPVPYLRRAFTLDRGVAGRARLHITALGLYRVWINGVELTASELFRPGWTDYRVRVHHQSYDCDALLHEGENVIAVALAKGWYAGRLGLLRRPGFYGDHPAVIGQIDMMGHGGAVDTVCRTDSSWTTHPSPILTSDLLRGETVDRRQEPAGWRDAGFDDAAWDAVAVRAVETQIVPQPHDSIRVLREYPGQLVREHARGPLVYDFGQNVVGWTRVESPLLAGTEVIVRHGEILTPSLLVYRDNLRGAFQEDVYSDEADGIRTLEPSFTSHGFRYAEVWGLPSVDEFGQTQEHPETSITAVAVETGHRTVGRFEASDDRLTALVSAIEWTVRDNFLEVATDCPQRDERHGWLGDAGVIAPTATYLFDTAAFLDKFATDAIDAQDSDGAIASYVPAVPPADQRPGAPGWADGYVRMVHLLVDRYGDLTAAERHADTLLAFAEHVRRHNPDRLRVNAVGADFADWLSLPERDGEKPHPGYAYTGAFSTAPKPVVGTAHTYRSFVQVSQVLARLGRGTEARHWADEAEAVRAAYRREFLRSDLTIADATQTVYAQAIGFGLVEADEARVMADLLADAIVRRGYVTTGIHGVQHVLGALARFGHRELAIDLLLRDDMPSWLYMIEQGGTTIWEKWDGIRPDGSLATAEMNSFNHCALGAVGGFLFEDLLGMQMPALAWDRQIDIAATYTERLDWVRGGYDSPMGQISSHWSWHGDAIRHELTVPAAVTTRLRAPDGYQVRTIDGTAVGGSLVEVPSGDHVVTVAKVGP